jgi:hypothetical protein
VRLVNTKAHAIVDYLLGIVLILSGWLFEFAGRQPVTTITAVAGTIVLLNTSFTQFEFGIFQLIPLRAHIVVDVIAGSLLAISPWLLAFHHQAYKPHFVFGLTLMCIGILSDRILWSEINKTDR